jgi:Tol biopolymer transport system component
MALAGLLATGAALASGCGEKDVRCSFYSGFASGDGYGLGWSPHGDEIAFGRADSFPPDVYVVKVKPWPDGLPKPLSLTADGKPHQLDNGNCASAQPAWSPDARRIAYAGNDGPHAPYDVWVMNHDGTDAHLIARGHGSDTGGDKDNPANAGGPHPEWAPDGRELAFDTRDATGLSAVWLVRPSRRGIRRLTPSSLPAEGPSWSPDGKRIVFSAPVADPRGGIWLIETDGSDAHQLTRGSDSNPAWSPDGRSIVFDRGDGNRRTIWVTESAGGKRRQLTTDDGSRPRWSPDGRWIAFVSNRDGPARLYVMDSRGLIERPLLSD